jgi:hypothetical protein
LNSAHWDWRIWTIGAAVLVIAGGAAIFRWLRRPPDPEEIERRRRAHLNQIGRIVEGHIVDLVEVPQDAARTRTSGAPDTPVGGSNQRKLVCYNYSISGVSYETSQDVTGLQDHAGFQRIVAGQSASIKYDPANPTDSILIADDWSGLR